MPRNDPLRRAHPYLCPAGFWTVGYGHRCAPDHPPLTPAEAEVYLAQGLMAALHATLRRCPVMPTLAREARFETSDFASAEQRDVTGFSLHLKRLGRGEPTIWQGNFTRIGQRLEVLALSKDD